MCGAIDRLLVKLAPRLGSTPIPCWVWSLDFSHSVCECSRDSGVYELIDFIIGVTTALGSNDVKSLPSGNERGGSTFLQLTAIVRLRFGEMLEAFAVFESELVVPHDQIPNHAVDKQSLAMLYHDSYCISVWTSAHAEYLATIKDVLANRAATETLVEDLMIPYPELYSVTNLSNLLHLGPLLERVSSPRCCSKTSQYILAILTRVTNAGSRGWETTLLSAIKESEGAVRVCTQCIAVALSGLNQVMHPGARKPWRERFVILRALRSQTQQDFKEIVQKSPGAVKEAIRLHLAAIMVSDSATLEAMRYARQPTGQLAIPPMALPHPSLAAAMHSMAAAGADMVASRDSVALAIQRNLVSEPRSRKKAESRSRHAKNEVEYLSYSSSWLGGRSGPSGAAMRPAHQVVSGLLSSSYRSIYIPFWLHGNHHTHRASRLDSAQYAALHHRSAAYKLCSLLPLEDFQRAQNLALSTVGSSLLTVDQSCKLLGIQAAKDEVPGLPCSASSRAVQEAELDVMKLSAHDAALLIAFTRITVLRSSILSYDLGPGTRLKQSLAICQRLLLKLVPGEDPCEAVQSRLPKHATVLFCCSECRRVVNSVQDNSGKDVAFNELGLSASMLTIDGDICNGHMRCAKRSSAALRTAVSLEAVAETVELEQFDPVENPLLPQDLRPATIVATMCKRKKKASAGAAGSSSASTSASASESAASASRDSSSEVAKFRRDLKSCFEQSQNAVSCGDVPLVCIPILGRAIRVFGSWYALCGMCGALTRFSPAGRFRNEICCLKCDFAMLAGKKAAAEMQEALPKPPPPACRFCGKVQPENGAGMKWRCVPSPADTGGRNASVPAPLRVCYYCPSHYRGWLLAAHKTMSTATIFSHLLSRARPIFGANSDTSSKRPAALHCDDSEAPKAKRQSKSTKRKSALTRVITKNNRRRRLSTS